MYTPPYLFFTVVVLCVCTRVYTHTQYILPLSRLSIFFIDEKKHKTHNKIIPSLRHSIFSFLNMHTYLFITYTAYV